MPKAKTNVMKYYDFNRMLAKRSIEKANNFPRVFLEACKCATST